MHIQVMEMTCESGVGGRLAVDIAAWAKKTSSRAWLAKAVPRKAPIPF